LKIIYVIDTLDTGGTEKSLLHICSRLKEVEPIIVTLFNKKHDLINDFRKAGVTVIEFGIRTGDKLWLPKAVKKLNKLFSELRPAIVHGHLYNGELAARLASKKHGHILLGAFVNDPYVEERLSQEPTLRVFKIHLYKFLDRLTAKRVNAFTSLTKAIAETNANILHIAPNKIKIIPRGRQVSSYTVTHPDLLDEFRFLCVARLLKRKGYFELIKAVRILKDKGYNIKVYAAGDGVDREKIKQFAVDNKVSDSIVFLGNCNNVPELLAKSHCFVLPSHYEGMGAAAMEAMFAAKPLIVSDIGVFKEQVEHKQTGLIFQTMNANDLAEKMEWMVNNYAEGIAMGLKAREFAMENFDIDKVALRYEEYYRLLAGEKKSIVSKQTVVA
jgi:glycosyltransferase involved in cell wall biosynthesis